MRLNRGQIFRLLHQGPLGNKGDLDKAIDSDSAGRRIVGGDYLIHLGQLVGVARQAGFRSCWLAACGCACDWNLGCPGSVFGCSGKCLLRERQHHCTNGDNDADQVVPSKMGAACLRCSKSPAEHGSSSFRCAGNRLVRGLFALVTSSPIITTATMRSSTGASVLGYR